MSPDVLPPADPKTGLRVGKYQILRRIGEGGMATIYLATSPGPGGFEKPVALKMLRPEFSQSREASDLLVREARLAAKLHHPNIVQVFDLGRIGSDYFMAMEWVDGTSLSRLLAFNARRGHLLPVDVVAYIVEQVAEALAYIHSGVVVDEAIRGLVHRDVSPSNVLISSSGAVKLTDFGIVKVLDAPAMTRDGVVKGKFAYMSPEQLRGEPIDHRSDLFSLGVVLFESLTARRLFHRKSLAATVAAVHAARVLPPSAINENLPAELDRIALRALSKAADDRFDTAASIASELREFTENDSRANAGRLVQELMEQMSIPNHRTLPSYTGVPQLSTPPSVSGAPAASDQAKDAAQGAGTVLLPGEDLPDTRVEDFQALERELGAVEPTSGYADLPEEASSGHADDFLEPGRSGVFHELSHALPLTDPQAERSSGIGFAITLIALTLGSISLFWWFILL